MIGRKSSTVEFNGGDFLKIGIIGDRKADLSVFCRVVVVEVAENVTCRDNSFRKIEPEDFFIVISFNEA